MPDDKLKKLALDYRERQQLPDTPHIVTNRSYDLYESDFMADFGASLVRRCAEIASFNETGVHNNPRLPSSARAILREFGLEPREVKP